MVKAMEMVKAEDKVKEKAEDKVKVKAVDKVNGMVK